MTTDEPRDADGPPPGHPYAAEIEAERRGWYVVADLVRRLTPDECVEPGYYTDPVWTVRDVVAHLGTWLAEAQIQLVKMAAGTYEGHDVDIDALNAALLEAMDGQPWEVAWVQANAGADPDARGVVRPADADRGSGLVDPQGRRRPLRRAPAPARGLGRGARRPPPLTSMARIGPGSQPSGWRGGSCHAGLRSARMRLSMSTPIVHRCSCSRSAEQGER